MLSRNSENSPKFIFWPVEAFVATVVFWVLYWERRRAAKEIHANAHFGGGCGVPQLFPTCNSGDDPLEKQGKWALGAGKTLSEINHKGFSRSSTVRALSSPRLHQSHFVIIMVEFMVFEKLSPPTPADTLMALRCQTPPPPARITPPRLGLLLPFPQCLCLHRAL